MRHVIVVDLLISLACVAAAGAGCAVDEPRDAHADPPLTAAYHGAYGFGLDSASAARLAQSLRPGETVEVVHGAQRTPLAATPWDELTRSDPGPYALEARSGTTTRGLGTLQLASSGPPQCQAAPPGDAPEERLAAPSLLAASCTNNAHAWFCNNCQCSNDGFHLQGMSQRYICIYGTWYTENLYACDCPFTSHTCGTI